MKNTYFFICFLSIYFSLNAYSSNLDVEECNSLDINYDEPIYAETEEERIIRMDQQLEALLNSFEECVEATNASFSETNSQSNNSSSSAASNSASGNEIIPNKKEDESKTAPVAENTNNQENTNQSNTPDDIAKGDNGSIPKDIPDIATDDTTAKQLRAVATEEKDPILKASYWDAYRKYKGIKPKE